MCPLFCGQGRLEIGDLFGQRLRLFFGVGGDRRRCFSGVGGDDLLFLHLCQGRSQFLIVGFEPFLILVELLDLQCQMVVE